MILHGANNVPESELTQHVQTFQQRLQSYPHWPEIDIQGDCPECGVPATDRPEN
jgi:glutathione-regulated potassium-efflux system ancillary protein KefF